MFPVLQIGPLAIQTPGLVMLLGLWFGLLLAERHASKHGVHPNQLDNLVLVALISGVLGARLMYVARYPAAFAASPLSLVSLNPGLLDPTGGAAIALIALLIYGNRKNMSLLPTLDALTPLLALMAIALGVSHLASGNAFGAATDLPWGIELWGEKRHPSQIYEILISIIISGVFYPGRSTFLRWKPGGYFFAFMAASSAGLLFLAAFRGDSTLVAGGFRLEQIFAWMVLAISLIGFFWLDKISPLSHPEDQRSESEN